MIELRGIARQPLYLTASPEAANSTATLPYIPGSAVRGALASKWITANGYPTASPANLAAFTELFEGTVHYRPMLIDDAVLEPLSLRRCKYRPSPGCFEHDLDVALAAATDQVADRCLECGSPMEVGKGATDTPTVSRTRTRLGANETASDGDLFSREALPAGTRMTGWIGSDHPWLAALVDESPITVWIGGRRTIGGRLEIRAQARQQRPPTARSDGDLVIRLISPGVFVDPFGRPLTDFPVDTICDQLDCKAVEGSVRTWVRPTRVGGWHLASGLPKPVDVALTPGSTLRFTPRQPVDPQRLAEIERTGIGLRRCEGLGSVVINPDVISRKADDSATAGVRRGVEVFTAIRGELLPAGDERRRLWVVDQLKEHAVNSEQNRRAASKNRIMALTATQDMNLGARRALEQVLDLDNIQELREVVALVDTAPHVLDNLRLEESAHERS